jgi:RNA polymerase sigma-32 factor
MVGGPAGRETGFASGYGLEEEARDGDMRPSSGTASFRAQAYITQVLGYPKLSAREERILFKKWRKTRRPSVKSAILTANLRYVVAIALTYRCYPVEIEDLISEGNLGLLIAFDKYRSSRGTRFITYGAYWVRAFMLSLIIRHSHNGRTGAGPFRSKIFFKIRREKAKSICRYGNCDRAYDDLAEKMHMPVDKVCDMATILETPDVSIDFPLRGDSTVTMLDFLQDAGPTPEETTMQEEKRGLMKRLVEVAMDNLDRREKYIIRKRIFEDDGASLAEIGRDLGVSRERARQLEGRAKKKIRTTLESSGICDYRLLS